MSFSLFSNMKAITMKWAKGLSSTKEGIGTSREWERTKLRGSPKAVVTKDVKET